MALAVLGGLGVVGAAREQHAASARVARAARLQAAIALVGREERLVVANRAAHTRARARAIARDSAELTRLLQTERDAAVSDHSQIGLLPELEIAAAALSVIAGPLLLFWLLRRHRLQVEQRHQRRVDQLAAQARTDSLTRLGNRRAFEDDLTLVIAARAETAQHFALMAVDLDGLKRINDTKGHPAGDEQIRKVAECIREVVGDEGSVYRTGGDEFMVILPSRRNWHGLNLAARIDQVTRARTGGRAVSIGMTESTEMEGRHLLMNQADIALYEAKRTRLSAVAYHPGLSPAVDGAPEDLPSHDQRALAAALARAVDAKDAGTRSHSETVAQLCVAIGQRLRLEPAQLERLRLAGLLHDVGKIGVADAILQKPEALAPEELSAMTEHVEIGHAILLAAELPLEAQWVLHHHERFDGEGYPSGLRGAAVPIESRIIAVADAFEAMTGARPYRDAVPVDEAVRELRAHSGTQFDARCVDSLVEVVNEAATEDDLIGIAHGGHFKSPLAPRRDVVAVPMQA